ncbi:MAG: glycoside hydrolase family 6 protein [Actinomycetota bacterium]|nr:glycoside hydrolase family 6 protein [Actinomycetota bacterium]
MSRQSTHSTRARSSSLLTVGLIAGALLTAGAVPPSSATSPSKIRLAVQVAAQEAGTEHAPATHRVLTSNPLAGRAWGVYKGNADQSWPPYVKSTGTNRQLLAKISLRPKAKWFGSWISNADIQRKVTEYIANSTGGDPNVLVQMTVFRMVPWEHDVCTRLPTSAEQASYQQWIDRFAAGIGNTHVALILQPDGPFALCTPHGSTLPSQLIGYSAKKFSALTNTSVYIDGGASDWPSNDPAKSAQFLMPAGVKYARGFALDSTHYVSTASDIAFGTRLVAELARRGAPGKHFVINTSSNGQPFTFSHARGPDPDNAKVCETKAERVCVTLGIPPTTDVANAKWGLSETDKAHARSYVDGYLWFGRPWLYRQADPFDLQRALSLARTTPY